MLGLLIVAIGMVGLANALTMSVLERMREVGILRCVGARARDIRRIFAAEGLALTLAAGSPGSQSVTCSSARSCGRSSRS